MTGGAGFLGAHLSPALAREGVHVDILDNFSRGARDVAIEDLASMANVEVIDRDLTRHDVANELPTEYDFIYHFAAIIGVANVLERPYDVLRDNISMLLSAVALAQRQRHLRRFVFASTSEVYAGSLEHLDLPFPTPEDVPLALPDLAHPRTSYMLSKMYGEALCHQAGVAYTIVRPHNIYGPRMGMAHVIPELLAKVDAATDGDLLEVYSIDHRRTFCYVDDAIAMIRSVSEARTAEGQVFNIGNQEPEVTIAELAALILEVVGRKLTVDPRPATPGSPARRCPDMSRTISMTGDRSHTGLRDGLIKTYRWYKTNVFGGKDEGGCSSG